MVTTCALCGGTHSKQWAAREQAFGLGDPFTYGECGDCGALQLLDPPSDWARYYPARYYAFASRAPRGIVGRIRQLRNRLVLGSRGPLARIVERIAPHAAGAWIARCGIRRDSRILDVGSGAGDLLRDLARAGYRNLLGVDLFVSESIEDPSGFRVMKGTVDEVRGSGGFDLVMFHHSLEHMVDQRGALQGAARLMAADGWCLIRVPVAGSEAWRLYGTDWVQLDAPRHIVLHTVASLTKLAGEAGLTLAAVEFDSTAFQFAGSEAFRRGLMSEEINAAFSRAEIRAYNARARELNARQLGDQAAFYFRKAPQS